MLPTRDAPKVLIVGAGLTGLAIAHGLQMHQIPFLIFEKESTPRERNWGVTISWAVPFLQKCLPPELFARLNECQPDPGLNNAKEGKETVLIRDGATGATLVEPKFPGTRRLQIARTRRIWGQALGDSGVESVKYGKVVTGIETPYQGQYAGKVVVKFDDGHEEVGDVLIGTDGGSSFVRGWVCRDINGGGEAWELGYHFLNFSFSLTREQALWLDERINPNVDVGCHPKRMYSGLFILDKPDLQRPETWVFYVLSTWPKSEGVDYPKDQDLLEEYQTRMAGWGDPYKTVADWIPPGTRVRPIIGGLKVFAPKEKWNNRGGRVTIGGDAAHSMVSVSSSELAFCPSPILSNRRAPKRVICTPLASPGVRSTQCTFNIPLHLLLAIRADLGQQTFHRGQGGNNALRDAERFLAAMLEVKQGSRTLLEAVDGYDQDVLERGSSEVEMSSQQTHAFHDYEAFLNSPIMKFGIKPTSKGLGK